MSIRVSGGVSDGVSIRVSLHGHTLQPQPYWGWFPLFRLVVFSVILDRSSSRESIARLDSVSHRSVSGTVGLPVLEDLCEHVVVVFDGFVDVVPAVDFGGCPVVRRIGQYLPVPSKFLCCGASHL